MSKEIIIDGVNVAECCYLICRSSKNPICRKTKKHYCKGFTSCYIKRYFRLKQENEALKKEIDSLNELLKSIG